MLPASLELGIRSRAGQTCPQKAGSRLRRPSHPLIRDLSYLVVLSTCPMILTLPRPYRRTTARLAVVRPCRWHASILVGFSPYNTMDKRSHPHVSVCALLMNICACNPCCNQETRTHEAFHPNASSCLS